MLTVEQHSFFDSPTGVQRFSEYWPPRPHLTQDHQICNYTRQVCERPEGIPNEVDQKIILSGEEGLPWDFNLVSGWLTFRWGMPNEKGQRPHDPHAYFMFGPSGGNNGLRVEVVTPHIHEDFLEHTFLGDLYLGNKIDTSRLINGHSPSKIVNLSSINPDDLWTHVCWFGKESFSFICGSEAEMWKGLIEKSRNVRAGAKLYLYGHRYSVEEIYRKIEGRPFLQLADEIRRALQPLALNISTTKFFKICKEFQARTV